MPGSRERLQSIDESFSSGDGRQERVKGDLSQLLSFRGRATRMEYLSGNLLLSAMLVVFGAVAYGVYSVCGRPLLCAQALSPLFALFWAGAGLVLWANSAQRSRRFHDFGAPTALALATTPLTPLVVFVALTWNDYPEFVGISAPPPSFLGEGLPLKLAMIGLAVVLFLGPALVPSTRRGGRFEAPAQSEDGK